MGLMKNPAHILHSSRMVCKNEAWGLAAHSTLSILPSSPGGDWPRREKERERECRLAGKDTQSNSEDHMKTYGTSEP